jgi:signal transduction histidine kinase
MNLKVRSLNQPKSDSVYSLATHLIDKDLNDRFGPMGWLGRASTRPAPASVNIAKYEQALKALGRELSRSKERERQRIAAQLHDEFGQDLLLAKMRLTELLDRLPQRHGHFVEGIVGIIEDLICRTRTIIDELSLQRLCETGLKAALQSLTKELQTKHGLICTTKLDLMPNLLKDQVQQVLFRGVRELLFNVVKHARASRVKVVVTRKPGSVAIEVCDDGRGFDRHKTFLGDLSIGRFGWFSVRADLAALGGDLHIFSHIGKGTRAVITLPIAAT